MNATLSPRRRAAFFAGTLMMLAGFHLATRESGRTLSSIVPLFLILGFGELMRETTGACTLSTADPGIRRRRKRVAAAAFAGAVAIIAMFVAFIMRDYTPGKLTSGLMIAAMMGLFGCGMGLTSNDVIRESQRRVKTRHEEPSPFLILFIPLAAMVVVVGISYWSVYDDWTAQSVFSRSRLVGLVMVTVVAIFGVRAAFGIVDEWQEHARQSGDVT